MNSRFKRRNYFINKEFQGRQIFNYFLLVVVGSLLFVWVFSFFSSNTLSIVYENYHLQLGVTPGILFKKILSTQWLFIMIGGLIIIVITLFLTHRVAGPFFRFEKSLDEMIDGDISGKIVLRDKDEGKSLAQKINAFNYILSDKLAYIEQFNNEIKTQRDTIMALMKDHGENSEEILQCLVKIDKSQQEIDRLLNDYTFTREIT